MKFFILNGQKKYIHRMQSSYGGIIQVFYGPSPSTSEYALGMTYLHSIEVQGDDG